MTMQTTCRALGLVRYPNSMSALGQQRPVRGFRRGTLVVLLACLGLLVGAASAAARKPVIVSLSVTPRVLPSSGGSFTVKARVRNAVTCTIYSYGLAETRTINCSSGRITFRRRAPANTTTGPYAWGVYIEAHSGNQNARSNDVEVEVPPAAPKTPPIRGFDTCTTGLQCDYAEAYESFPTWGNVAPVALGDCTFAAAADWEQLLLGVHANETELGYEFAQAGGTAERGLGQNALWTYWRKYGIAGIQITGTNRYTTDQAGVENAVNDYRALIVEFSFAAGDWVGFYTMPNTNLHDAVVDGYTPEGPLVVTWGETLQMTWEQWDDEVVGMWGIGAS
jgi:hypothetical protein